jgi:hypothetical protein
MPALAGRVNPVVLGIQVRLTRFVDNELTNPNEARLGNSYNLFRSYDQEARIGKVTNVFNWIAQEDILALARDEAVQAGENARLQLELLELEEADEEFVRETMRRRLARTLVQLGMKIDPLAGEDAA